MTAYYNEFDPKAAAWLRELIADGLIAPGDVDERSITEVQPDDVKHYTQCHFFAGIGGWSYALRLAGWPDDRPVWTGSCPCPPFSSAGKKKRCPVCGGKPIPHPLKTGIFACVPCGHEWFADGRHLWPEFRRIIAECDPAIVFGEQVAGGDGLIWLAGVRATLEALDRRVGAADLCAAGVLAPHIRQRLYWVADASGARREGQDGAAEPGSPAREGAREVDTCGSGACDRLADAAGCAGPQQQYEPGKGLRGPTGPLDAAEHSGLDRLEHPPRDGRQQRRTEPDGRGAASGCGDGGMVYAGSQGPQGHAGHGDDGNEPGRIDAPAGGSVAATSAWSASTPILCRDGKARRVPFEREIQCVVNGLPAGVDGRRRKSAFPLAEKTPGRVMLLRGYGNAVVPQVAASFIKAYMMESPCPTT